jgi:protein-disulfide isomerase
MIRQILSCSLALVATIACAQTPPETGSTDDAVARFGDDVVTQSDLDAVEELRLQLIAIKQQEYDAKRQHLDRLIFEKLVDRAAEAAGVSREEYLKTEVTDRISEPTEDQINQVMSAYRARLNPDPEKAREQVVGLLRQQSQQQQTVELQKRLFNEAGVEILLEPLRFDSEVADYNPTRGAGVDAVVTLVEYSDFQCPYCSRVQPALDEIVKRYPGQVRHVFKHLPLPMHGEAKLAAEASLCAEDQGRFWELHDWMFDNPRRINRSTLVARAEAMEMDTAAFTSCLDSKTHADNVQRDMSEANSLGISGTPGFLVNGRMLRGAQPLDAFIKVIDEELQKAGVDPAAPAAPSP